MTDSQLTRPTVDPDVFCSALSRELQEPMFASAVDNDVWFLLEYNGAWREKATEDNDLPRDAQDWLDTQVAATMGRGRVQFIKQERQRSGDYLSFCVAIAHEVEPRMYRFMLDSYLDLLQVDVAGLLSGVVDYEDRRLLEPVYLVCTNGRRDRCCALFGLEVYYRLEEVAGDAAWQTTHVGGHRFAANVLTFPDGTYFGRLRQADVEAFYQTRQRGEIALEHLRGRSCYREVVQAADYFLRRETNRRTLHAFRFADIWSSERDEFRVTFEALEDGARHEVNLVREEVQLPIYASCGKPRVEPVDVYRLASVEKMIGG